jgi:hypothetical protein
MYNLISCPVLLVGGPVDFPRTAHRQIECEKVLIFQALDHRPARI